MKKTEILNRIGLSKNEAKIYLTLVSMGPSSITAISEKTGIHRPLIYKAMPELQQKGLIRETLKNKRKLFVAESPDHLRKLLEEVRTEFEELLPELKSVHATQKKKPVVKFLEGKEGIKSVFYDLVHSMPKEDTFYRFSSAKDVGKANSYLPKDYREVRDRKKLERFVISNESGGSKKKPRLERAMKILPNKTDPFEFDVTEVVYGDKVVFIDYESETATVIENPKIAKFSKSLFKSLYKRL